MTFSLVTIVHRPKGEEATFQWQPIKTRIVAVHTSAVASGLPFDLILIDNSPDPIQDAKNIASELGCIHQWCDGYNTFHGPSMNIAAKISQRDAIIYFCASHGRVIDDSWIADILAPLVDPKCGMSGSIAPCLFDRVSTDHADWKRPQLHIQGAVAAMRRELLLEIPYSHRFPFEYSDVEHCLTLIQRGYLLVNVDSIRSVAIGRAKTKGAKYIHDYQ